MGRREREGGLGWKTCPHWSTETLFEYGKSNKQNVKKRYHADTIAIGCLAMLPWTWLVDVAVIKKTGQWQLSSFWKYVTFSWVRCYRQLPCFVFFVFWAIPSCGISTENKKMEYGCSWRVRSIWSANIKWTSQLQLSPAISGKKTFPWYFL